MYSLKQMNNTTLVTALYDIGREQYTAYPRSIDTYLRHMDNILSFNSNLVIFCDKELHDKILDIRKQYDKDLSKTIIINKSFKELECYKLFYEKVKTVMKSEHFLQHNEGSIESIYPEYNIINFNKISFVCEAIETNPFKSQYFFWVDAGFYHDNFPKELREIQFPNKEKEILLNDNKVHFLSLCSEQYIPLESMFSSRVSIAGSMFAGKAKPLLWFKNEVYNTINDFINNNAINDDQTIYAFVYSKNKELFNISYGNWFHNIYIFV